MAERELAASLDLRYVGQNFELSIPVPGGASGTAPKLPAIDGVMRLFWAAHDRSYGYHNPHDPVELVNIRLVARRRRQFKAPPAAPVSHRRVPEAVGRRQVWFFAGGPHSAAIFDRARLEPGQTIAGPAIVEQMDSTTPVYPGDTLRVDNVGNLLIEIRR
jgi:N-methylhydantoinase A